MKMTRLEWRYLQQIALDHPYFDTHELPLTEKEAKAIVAANVRLTGAEFVDSVYAKLGMTRPVKEKKRFAWLSNIGELFTVPPIRRIAITVLVVALITVFFTATPIGRTIAESVIRYISRLDDNDAITFYRNDEEIIPHPVNTALVSINTSDTTPVPEDTIPGQKENGEVYVDSFEAFTAAMGVQPKVLPFPYTKLSYDYDKSINYLRLRAYYETPKGMIVTSQYWYTLDLLFATEAGYTVYDADPSVYYSFDNDGMLIVVKAYEDTAIGIIAIEGYSYTVEEILTLLDAEPDTTPVPEDTLPEQEDSGEVYIDSFEAFTAATGVQPKVLPFPYTKLFYVNDEFQHNLWLNAYYETPKGMIVTSQYWYAPNLLFGTQNGYTVYDADPSVYYSFDNDGTLNVVKAYEDTVIGIIAVYDGCSYTVDEILRLLDTE